MTDLNQLLVADITPGSIKQDPQIQAMSAALQPQLNDVTNLIPTIELYSRIDELPEPILRMLAVEHRVYRNEWSLATTIEAKRDLIKNSFDLNKRRGTLWSVERVLGLLNINAVIQEWFDYGGAPYYFRVSIFDIAGESLTSDQLIQAQRLINQYKPLRASLESIDATVTADTVNAYAGAANTMIMVLESLPFEGITIENEFNVNAGTVSGFTIVSETYPE